jgi:hypothetical protein
MRSLPCHVRTMNASLLLINVARRAWVNVSRDDS